LNPVSPGGDFSDSNADPDGDGYSNLEDYLNWVAAPHPQFERGGGPHAIHSRSSRFYRALPVQYNTCRLRSPDRSLDRFTHRWTFGASSGQLRPPVHNTGPFFRIFRRACKKI
jgi:hypothetical protein